jgi:hypothetical protein
LFFFCAGPHVTFALATSSGFSSHGPRTLL